MIEGVDWKAAGRAFANGVVSAFAGWIVLGLILSHVANNTTWLDVVFPRDATDGPSRRSGVEIVTDHETGMQYLRTRGGGIVPRIGADGEQMRGGE
jgi:hypothetical protein